MAQSGVRQELLAQLKGQEVRFPDLQVLFKHWPMGINPAIEDIRASVPRRLLSITASAKKRKVLAKIDSGLFSSTWWPAATLEAGDILSCLILWIFIWDDEIDSEMGDLAIDFQAAQTFRQETINYARYCLKLSEESAPRPVPPNEIIAFFKLIGDVACEAYDLSHRELLLRELEFFMDTSEVEQRFRLSSEIPSPEDYMRYRMGTSAVNVTTFFNEYAHGMSIPAQILKNPDMKIVWDQTNIIIWATNDLFSLKKELAHDTIDNLVPLLYHRHGNLDLAVSLVVETIENAVKDFDLAAEALARKFSDDKKLMPRLETYIRGCQLNCTGNLNWSLQTGRYGVSQDNFTGGVTIRLE